MMKHEFEKLINNELTPAEYEVIETVYMDYPTPGPGGQGLDKDETARLFLTFGFRIFEDMLPRAKKIQANRAEIQKAKSMIAMYEENISRL